MHSSKIGSGKHVSSAKSCFRRTCLEWYGFIAVLWSLYLLENSTSGVHSHDNQRARQRHKHKQSRNARGGALAAHHLAWVGHHTGGSSSTPTVHPCLVRQGRCRWLTALSTPKTSQHGSGAAVLVVVEQERSASVCTVSILVM